MHHPKSNRLGNVSNAVYFSVFPISAFYFVVIGEDNDIGISPRGQQKFRLPAIFAYAMAVG
jgi:hypothetical protein